MEKKQKYMNRCKWVNLKNELYVKYHDDEWGVPSHDDRYLFEMLILESFQAGLSWECVLNKREAFRIAYDNFDIEIGKRLAQLRCDEKIADKRANRALDKYLEAEDILAEAMAYYDDMRRYYDDSEHKHDMALADLVEFEKNI